MGVCSIDEDVAYEQMDNYKHGEISWEKSRWSKFCDEIRSDLKWGV